MKELCIVRHAKSDWAEEFLNDIDRQLSPRGLNDAYFMSDWFSKNKTAPDLILTSTATRALSTALIFARKFKLDDNQVKLEPKIYEADVSTLLKIIQSQPNTVQRIMLFGHNPGLSNLCNTLSDDLFFDNLPTCALSSFLFTVKSWKEIAPKKGKLNYYEFPKNFKNYDR